MIVAIWLTLRILFFLFAAVLCYYYVLTLKKEGTFRIFKHGLRSALKDCGFHMQNAPGQKYSIDLYKWTINEHEEICEDSLDRATWPAMDIADWMKEGLPRASDGTSLCGRDCQCKLTRVRVKRTRQPK